jgi:hypothetical protein
MPHGEMPLHIVTCSVASGTLPLRGQVVIQSNTGDAQQVLISTANAAKIRGVAFEDCPALGVPFKVCTLGVAKVKTGAGVTQDQAIESDASGNAINTTAGAGRNTVGRFLETGNSADLVLAVIMPLRYTTS